MTGPDSLTINSLDSNGKLYFGNISNSFISIENGDILVYSSTASVKLDSSYIGFFRKAPVAQPTGTIDIGTALKNLGLLSLTATPQISTAYLNGSIPQSQITNLVTDITGKLSSIPVNKTIFVSATGSNSTGTRGRMDLPFLTIDAAVAVAASGDLIKVGPGTFTITSLKLPNDVSITGEGIDVTIITSTANLNTTGVILNPGNNSIISNLTVTGNAASGVYQAPIGNNVNVSTGDFTNAILYRVKCNADSDGIFSYPLSTSSLTAYNCIFNTKFDAITGYAGFTADCFNCIVNVTGPSTMAGTIRTAGLTSLGCLIRYYGGAITVTGAATGSTGNYGAYTATSASAAIEMYNTRLKVTTANAVPAYDFYRTTGTVGIKPAFCSRHDGAAFSTFGVTVYLDTAPIINSLNNSAISGTIPAIRLPALTGDVTTTAATAATTIANNSVSYAKMQDISAASLLLGRGSDAGAGDPQEITIGSGLTMTGATLSASGGGGMTWTEVTGTSQTASVDSGYISNNVSLVTITLPATAVVGKIIKILGKGAGGWKLAQNASQLIRFGNQVTTTGTNGYLSSSNQYDNIEIICTTANTTWMVTSAVGNITYV